MTTETALTLPKGGGALVKAEYNDDQFKAMTTSADFFPRLQVMGGNSDAVKEELVPMGTYAVIKSKEDLQDVGKQVDALVCSWRLKAMEIGDDEVTSIFDPKNPEFTRIRDLSGVQDSGCLCGPEFLLYLPCIKDFVTFYMASKSAQRLAPKLRSYINEKDNIAGASTLGIDLASNKKYKWHVSTVANCSTPFDLPNPEDFSKALEKFQNPPVDEKEAVKETEERAR
jgi:hypothetical protein